MREYTRQSKLLRLGIVKSVLDMLAVVRNLREYILWRSLSSVGPVKSVLQLLPFASNMSECTHWGEAFQAWVLWEMCSTSGKLRQHERTHAGEKNFSATSASCLFVGVDTCNT